MGRKGKWWICNTSGGFCRNKTPWRFPMVNNGRNILMPVSWDDTRTSENKNFQRGVKILNISLVFQFPAANQIL